MGQQEDMALLSTANWLHAVDSDHNAAECSISIYPNTQVQYSLPSHALGPSCTAAQNLSMISHNLLWYIMLEAIEKCTCIACTYFFLQEHEIYLHVEDNLTDCCRAIFLHTQTACWHAHVAIFTALHANVCLEYAGGPLSDHASNLHTSPTCGDTLMTNRLHVNKQPNAALQGPDQSSRDQRMQTCLQAPFSLYVNEGPGQSRNFRSSGAVWPGCWHSMGKPCFLVYDHCSGACVRARSEAAT